jgi:hypothetical protein
VSDWAIEAEANGADAVCAWPVSFDRLDALLHARSR